jgi:MFS transporter, AAHS family, 4-hydroxybenzoate transporter
MKMTTRVVQADTVVDNSRIGGLSVLVAILAGTVLAVDGFDTQALGYVAPQLTRLWKVSPDLLGYMFSSALVGLMIGYLVISPLAGRFGQKRVSTLCVASFGLLTMLTATASGPYDLMAYRLLTGIGLGGAIPPAVALCGEYAPKRFRSSFITYMYVGLSLGQVAAGGVSLWLLQSHGWQAVLLVGGVLPLIYALVMWVWLPESLEYRIRRGWPQAGIAGTLRRIDRSLVLDDETHITVASHSSQGAGIARLFQSGRSFGTMMIWLALFMNLFVLFFFQNWLPTIFQRNGMTVNEAISATTAALSGGIIAALVIGPLMDRFGAYRVMTGLFIVGGVFMACIGFADASARALMLAAGFCAGFCLSGIQKSANALAVFFYPISLRSTGLGWGLGIGRAGAILGPAVAGNLFAAHWSVEAVFYAFALPMLVGAVAVFVMGRYYQGGRAEDRESVALRPAGT